MTQALPARRPALATTARIGADALSVALIAVAVAWALGTHRMLGLFLFTEQFLALCLALGLGQVFLSGVADNRHPVSRAVDGLFALTSLVGGGYLAIAYPQLSLSAAINPASVYGVSVAVLCCLVVGLYRVAGLPLTVIVLGFVAYGRFGDRIPGPFQALTIGPERLAAQLALDTGGILGMPLAIAATVVVVFIAFGRLLEHLGGAALYTDLATAALGGFRGGAAKISILASSLFGAVSGSAVSNVATTGVVTIPLMRRAGFRPDQAAGVEAVASTGGQLTPPVMGAAAFLMAEFLQIPFTDVVLAALVPAALYYLALFVLCDLTAARDGIQGLPSEDRPRVLPTLARGWPFLAPFAALIWALFALNYQPATAGLVAILVLVAASLVLPSARAQLGPKGMVRALAGGGRGLAQIVVITGAAGIVIGVLNETGLGFGLTASLTDLAGGSAVALLVLAAGMSIILGMGMPTIAVYVLLAALVAPGLVRLGIEPIAAHLFVLYFGMMSMITPPVAIAAFAAASIAETGPMRTALQAMLFGWPAYALPFAFALAPVLILQDPGWLTVPAVVSAAGGVVLVSAALVGHGARPLSPVARIAASAAGLAFLAWPVTV